MVASWDFVHRTYKLEVQIFSPKSDLGVKGICEVFTAQGGLDIMHIFLIFTDAIFINTLLC